MQCIISNNNNNNNTDKTNKIKQKMTFICVQKLSSILTLWPLLILKESNMHLRTKTSVIFKVVGCSM